MGVPPCEECSKEGVKPFIQGSSSGSLSSFRPVIWFLFPHLTYAGTLPWGAHTYLSQDGSPGKASGRSETIAWHYPLASDPQGGFLCTCSALLSRKSGGRRLLFIFIFFYFILLYNTVLVLPHINMNLTWVYTCSQS